MGGLLGLGILAPNFDFSSANNSFVGSKNDINRLFVDHPKVPVQAPRRKLCVS
jgi:hypothetical protein